MEILPFNDGTNFHPRFLDRRKEERFANGRYVT